MRLYTDYFILTPGPTEIPHRIRMALARESTNPDLDPEFLEKYNHVREMLKRLVNAVNGSVYIMVGEAMLGLEAAIANLLNPNDKVLVIANGVFGEGFADIIKAYNGIPILIGTSEDDWRKSIDIYLIDRELERNKDVVAVTLVHCDTPSAILNDLPAIARVVKQYGVLLIVDAVSSIGGIPINFDDNGIDILIGGSQKVLNVPPGLTIMAISKNSWSRMEEVNYRGFYLNLRLWRDNLDIQGIFPYTMSDALIYALEESLEMIFNEGIENVYKRHIMARNASWKALEALGLTPFPKAIEFSSPTVTAFLTPSGITDKELREYMWKKYGVMLAGSWGRLQGKIVRIGHMGIQASRTHLLIAYTTLAKVLKERGYNVRIDNVIDAIEDTFK
jgi:alanine-glyoxylate transaminase/serine-glyoxylate transaminase/serine-pyruvate transaminase